MNQQTIEATIKSIAHWRDNRYAEEYMQASTGRDDCALCGIYNTPENVEAACVGCPVREEAKNEYCANTPYMNADIAYDGWRKAVISDRDDADEKRDEFRECAQKMVDFLIDLLPGDIAKKQRQLDNRHKWARFLMQPERQKLSGMLGEYKTEKRCCIGHACAMMGIEEGKSLASTTSIFDDSTKVAPKSVVGALGLRDEVGAFANAPIMIDTSVFRGIEIAQPGKDHFATPIKSLADLNDNTPATPQEIGRFILENIENTNLWDM